MVPSTVRSDEWAAWFSFWFSGYWRALAKGTAWAGFYCAILLLLENTETPVFGRLDLGFPKFALLLKCDKICRARFFLFQVSDIRIFASNSTRQGPYIHRLDPLELLRQFSHSCVQIMTHAPLLMSRRRIDQNP